MDDAPQQVVQTHKAAGERRRVAVIAVHGVGKHAPGETQNALADLLLSLPAGEYGNKRTYQPFTAQGLRIPLQPLRLGHPRRLVSEVKRFYQRSIFTEQSADFARNLPREAGVPPEVGEVSTEYTELLLKDYRGGADSNVYETVRLEGRAGDGDEVHIYEVLWADLAKPDNSILAFFFALFQLLLHLGGLSRLAVDSGAAEADHFLWTMYRWCQRWAVRMLQIFIPVIEILLFITLTSSFSSIASPTRGNRVIPILLGGIAAHLPFFLAMVKGRWKLRFGWLGWSLLALLPGTLGSSLAFALMRVLGPDRVSALLWWLVVGGSLIGWILSSYQDRRRGVATVGWAMFILAFCMFFAFLLTGKGQYVPVASFWTAEVLLSLVRLFWCVMIVLVSAAVIIGRIAHRWGWPALPVAGTDEEVAAHRARRVAQKARAGAALRTSRLALALPSVLFLLVTTLLWNGFTHLAEKQVQDPLYTPCVTSTPPPGALGWLSAQHKYFAPTIPTFASDDPDHKQHLCVWPAAAFNPAVDAARSGAAGVAAKPMDQDHYVANMLAWSVGYQLPLTLVLLGVAGFLMGWWALPSVLTERFPLRADKAAPRWSTDGATQQMGFWLSRGLDSTRAVTWLLWCSIFLMPAVYTAANWLYNMLQPGAPFAGHMPALHHDLGRVLGILTRSTKLLVVDYAALATVILAALAKGGQTALSIVLDVDTYLRASPEDATPRAKIFERYISTLRYVDAQKYDGVVIAAHSLGALISGDLLHFVHAKNKGNALSHDLDRVPPNTSLFTFGNPTRQLLNRFFPYLYDWVRAVPDNSDRPLPPPAPESPLPVIGAPELPLARDLGVIHWASAYRSGDYVGRSLWLNEWFWRLRPGAGLAGLKIIRSEGNDRAEVCIGAGAHTHYMDDTAPEMAVMLDSLIRTGRI